MNKNAHLNEQLRQIHDALERRNLSDALKHMISMATTYHGDTLIDEIEDILRNYNSVLNYLRESHNVVQLDIQDVQSAILQRCVRAWSKLSRHLLLCDEKSIYTQVQMNTTIRSWKELWSSTLEGDERYVVQDQIFNYLWTSSSWDTHDTACWYEFISRQNALVAQHWIGGITQSLWQFWDDQKVLLLKMLADSIYPEVSMQASVGYIVAAQTHPSLFCLFPQTLIHEEDHALTKNICTLQAEFVRMKESSKLAEEESNDPELNVSDFGGVEQEQMERIINAQQRYQHIRMERGLDMSFSKRVILRMCPFLKNTQSHWWAPFDEGRNEAMQACYDKNGNVRDLYRIIVEGSHECDLQLHMNCHMLASNNVRVEVRGEVPEDLVEHIDRTPLALEKRVVHNLYRIAELSPAHQLLQPIFKEVFFANNPVLLPCFTAEEILVHANHIIEVELDENVITPLEQVMYDDGMSANLAVLLAAAYSGENPNYAKALHFLRQADLLQEANADILKRMAFCCNRLGKQNEEFDCLQRLVKIEPDSVTVNTGLSHILYQRGEYEQAKKYLFKLCYEHPDFIPARAQLILSEMHLYQWEQARKHLDQLCEEYPQDQMALTTAGIYHLLQHDYSQAITYFRKVDTDTFKKCIGVLHEFGFDPIKVNLLIDALSVE